MTNDLPTGWTWTTLEKIASWGSGGTPKRSEHRYYGGNIPWAVIGDLNDGKITECGESITQEGLDNSSCKLVEPGTVLVAMYGSIGKLGIAGMQMATNQAIAFANPHVDRNYLFYYLLSQRHALATAGKGATQRNISQTILKPWPIPVAPSAEQKRIVATIEEHFSRLDAVDTALKATRTKMDALQRSAAATVFGQPDWIWTTLGEIAVLKGGITKDSKREVDPDFVEYPYLRVANVQRGFLDLSEVTTIRADPHKATKLVLQPGDILFNEGGDRDKLGRGWVWEGQIANCIHQNHVFRARLTDDDFDPYFISMHANTWGQRWFDTHGKQTTNLASISMTTLKSFPVPAPPPDEQRTVVDELQSILKSEDRLQSDLDRVERRSKTLRRAVLLKAFSGQLVPQDPNDEPASVLLERIASSRVAC